MRDLTSSTGDVTRSTRRDIIKKAIALGPVAYAAPMILGSATSVSAQVISNNPLCAGQTCVTFTNCNGNPNCFCFSLANGNGFCGTGVQCAGLAACSAQAPCAAGFVCQVDTCCGAAGICVPAATQCPAGGPAVPATHPTGSAPFTSSVN